MAGFLLLATSGAAVGSVWGDKGTVINLSTTTTANDTAVNSASASWSMVRGTQAWGTGKHYYEVKVLVAPTPTDSYMIGLVDNATANGAGLDNHFGGVLNGAGNFITSGGPFADDVGATPSSAGSGWAPGANNDILGVAWDATNKFTYLALNNVWFNSGDPTSGATGTGNVCSFGSARTLYPALAIFGLTGTYQLKTSTLSFTPPSGYSAWG